MFSPGTANTINIYEKDFHLPFPAEANTVPFKNPVHLHKSHPGSQELQLVSLSRVVDKGKLRKLNQGHDPGS
jgi:hypothetical protein